MTTLAIDLPAVITADELSDIGATSDEVADFVELFDGDGMPLNRENLARAMAAGISVERIAEHLLLPAALYDFEAAVETAQEEYRDAESAAEAAFERARETDWADDGYQPNPFRSGESDAVVAARAVYESAETAARRQCAVTIASVLADALGLP